jgi:hypothetical protein
MTHSAHPIGNAPPYSPIAWARNGDRALARARLRRWARSGPCAAVYALGILGSSVPAFTVLVVRASLTVTPATLLFAALAWLAFVHLARWMTWVDRGLAACWAECNRDRLDAGAEGGVRSTSTRSRCSLELETSNGRASEPYEHLSLTR